MTFAIGALVGLLTWIWRPKRCARSAAAAGLDRRRRRAVRLSRAVFPGVALRAAGRGRAVELSLAAADRAVFVAAARRTAGAASHHRRGARACRHGAVVRRQQRRRISRRASCPDLIAAFVAAFVWAAYSVMSRKLKSVPTDAVAGFCLVTALLAALVHGLVEVTVWPESRRNGWRSSRSASDRWALRSMPGISA